MYNIGKVTVVCPRQFGTVILDVLPEPWWLPIMQGFLLDEFQPLKQQAPLRIKVVALKFFLSLVV